MLTLHCVLPVESKNVQYRVQSHSPGCRERRRISWLCFTGRGPSAHGLDPWASRDPRVEPWGIHRSSVGSRPLDGAGQGGGNPAGASQFAMT
jgi:hypothetical protein